MTVTVKLAAVAEGGVPLNTPAALSISQDGRPVADHAYGVAPPLAAKVNEYAVPTVAAGSGDVVVIVTCAATMIESALDAMAPALSVTEAVKEKVPPDPVGVPEIKPVELNVSPGGSAPEATLQVTGGVPP